MMTLRVYLATQEITLREFAKRVGSNASYLSNVMSKKSVVSERLAKDVLALTNGQVSLPTKKSRAQQELKLEPTGIPEGS